MSEFSTTMGELGIIIDQNTALHLLKLYQIFRSLNRFVCEPKNHMCGILLVLLLFIWSFTDLFPFLSRRLAQTSFDVGKYFCVFKLYTWFCLL